MQDSKATEKASGITPSQTVGPYFAYGLTPGDKYEWNDAFSNNLITPDVTGERIRVEGRVFDGDGAIVPDCMLEVWQADAQGRFADPQDKRALPNASFRGFGRVGTNKDGGYAFDTIRPGPVPDPDGKPQAPHILLAVFARGMLMHLYTRIDTANGDPLKNSPANPDVGGVSTLHNTNQYTRISHINYQPDTP